VVAFADVEYPQPVEGSEVLEHGGEIRQGLGGVLLGAHGVDESHLLLTTKRPQLGRTPSRACDQAVEHAREHRGSVADRLARTQLQIVRAIADNVGTETQRAAREGCPSPGGSHPEKGANHTPAQDTARAGWVGGEVTATVYQLQEIVILQIRD